MFSSLMPDLRAFELLESIARNRSITLAAGELGISQQAASLRLRRLEQRLGRRLVARASRSSELTDDGSALLQLAQPVLEAAMRLDLALEDFLTEDSPLAIAVSATIAEYFLPQWIGHYVARGNDTRLLRSRATNTREVIRLVSRGEADIGFVEGSGPPPGLHYRCLADDELGVYVAPEHPWAAERRIGAWTLAGMPMVTREQGSGCREVLLAALLEHGVERSACAAPALELPSNTAVLESAAAGVAPAVISTRAAQRYVDDGRLLRVRVAQVSFHRQLGAVWKHGAEPSVHAANELLHAAVAAGSKP